jgi:hypothetical protein
MTSTDKLIISNETALSAKYGAAGLAAVQAALQALVAADAQRGLATTILAIDDARAMAKLGGVPVVNAADERGAKAAVDAAFAALTPDYIVLLDGPDVVPHIMLNPISGLNDDDRSIASDLPYASTGGWSRQAANYLSVTRVVGRLPAAEGLAAPDTLIALIQAAAAHQPLQASDYQKPFAISADVWRQSTQLSIAAIFGAGTTLLLSPPDSQPALDPALASLAHFINCHGAQADENFYGQQGTNYPIALSSTPLGPNIRKGTVVAAECCYGAELYNYTLVGNAQPICLSYLLNGAIAFLGSTNIAYGPPTTNAQADLLAQYFLQTVLNGASTGRALLQARQDFIRTQVMSSPANLKTIAQFILLGDPSCQACLVPAAPAAAAVETGEAEAKAMVLRATQESVLDGESDRKARRVALHGEGLAAGAAASRPGPLLDMAPKLAARLRALASDHGIEASDLHLIGTSGGAFYRSAVKNLEADRRIAVVIDRSSSNMAPGPSIKLMIAHIMGDAITRVEMSESR